ncbi:MAG: hypothetical protein AAF171_17110 [Cyanobacteria bacterium P01_A01_bin.116]
MKKFFILMGAVAIAVCCLSLIFHRLPSQPVFSQAVPASTTSTPFTKKQRGVSWTAGRDIVTQRNLTPLTTNSVNWIAQTPFGWQEDYDTPQLSLITTGNYWGETDEGLSTTTRLAQAAGIHTLLKPHIWLTRPRDGKWRSDIEMRSEKDWQTWFANYRTFMLHYANFAQTHDIAMLCVGTELQLTAIQREQDWRALIADIRQVYDGKLTYAANWYEGFENIPFWDALDFIGIQAYFPLSTTNRPTLEDLKEGWRSHLPSIEQVAEQFQKPVLFTEIGYRSTDNAAIKPWEWPAAGSEINPTLFASNSALTTQANCYEAFFQTVWPQEWLAGAYFWKWFPQVDTAPGKVGRGFTPQNKPAEQVLKKWYETTQQNNS